MARKPIDIEKLTPAWEHTIEVRTGVFARVLSPLEHKDPDSAVRLGLVWRAVNLWRRACIKVWGRPPVKMLREQVSAMIAPEDRRIVTELSDGELLRVHAAYVGLQTQWYGAIVAAASKAAGVGSGQSGVGACGPVASGQSGVGESPSQEPDSRVQRIGVPVNELVHTYGPGGGRLPQAIGGMRIGAAAE